MTGFDDLTPREHEVALLVSQGLTNRAIAERLFLAGGTVSNYVGNALWKLTGELGNNGYTNRRVLAAIEYRKRMGVKDE